MPGVAEASLQQVIPRFYERVRADDRIGPLFNSAIDDWDRHLEHLIAFWSSVMNTSGRYKGSPVSAHLRHKAAIDPAMFDRWLALWAEVTGELLAETEARAMQAKAANIAESLKLALFFRLPPEAPPQPHRTTATCDEATLPPTLRRRHKTKAGTWGLLRVESGEVDLVFHDPAERVRVTPEAPAEIPPQAWHHVETSGPMRMRIEFYRERPMNGRRRQDRRTAART